MKRYALFIIGLMAIFLIMFIFVEAVEIQYLSEENFPVQETTWLAGAINFALLLFDIILPMPSSLIMIANGALFGMLGGALLSLVAVLGSSIIGFWIGRRSETLLQRLVKPEERSKANDFLQKWGIIAIILSRPVPILSETLIIVAGTSSLTLTQILLASLIGYIPLTLLYAFVGEHTQSFAEGILAFLLVILVASLTWLITRFLPPPQIGNVYSD